MRALLLAIACLLVHTAYSQKKPRKKLSFIVNDASVYVGKTHFNSIAKDVLPADIGRTAPANSLIHQLNLDDMTSVQKGRHAYYSNSYNLGVNTSFRFTKNPDSSQFYHRLTIGFGFAKNDIQNTTMVDKRPFRTDTVFGPNNELYAGIDSVAETRLNVSQVNDFVYASISYSLESCPKYKFTVSVGYCFDFGVMYNTSYAAMATDGYKKYLEPVSMNNFGIGNPDERDDLQFGMVKAESKTHILFEEKGVIKPRFAWRFALPLGFSYKVGNAMRITAQLKYGGGGGNDVLETNLGLRYTFNHKN